MKNEQLLIDLSDEQCEKVVGGVGRLGPNFGGAGAGTQGWFGNGAPPPGGDNNGLYMYVRNVRTFSSEAPHAWRTGTGATIAAFQMTISL